MSISFLDRLNQLFELLAAKRTPEQEAEDRRSLKKLLKEKEAKDQKRREEKGQKPLQYRKEAKPKAKPQDTVVTKQNDAKSIVEKLKAMADPKILLVSSTNMTTEGSTEDDAKAGYSEFKKSEDIKSILENCINLTNVEGIHSWIGSPKDIEKLMGTALYIGLDHAIEALPDDLLEKEEPFKELAFGDMKGIKKESKVRLDLNEAWKPIFENLAKQNQEEQPESQPETETETETEPPVETPEQETQPEQPPDAGDKKEEEEESDEDLDVEDAPKVNVGKFRSLKEPYIFLLDPRKRYQDYLNFLGPDEKDAKVKKASQVLTRSSVIKFLVSKKIKSQELAPVIIYFLSGKDAADLKVELKRESRPHFILSEFDKSMFDKDEPFSDLKLGDIAVDKLLVDEMNRIWIEATSQSSGNPIPAVQANTQVPLDYFRLLNKKHRPIQVYIGNQPEGSGSENTIYVLATEQEAESFVALVRKFKMSSLFYERMSANSDIDVGFKNSDPKELMPTNVLILRAVSTFDPKKIVEPTEYNKDLMEVAQTEMKEVFVKIEKLQEKKATLIKKAQDKAKGKEDPKAAEKLKKEVEGIDEEIKKLEESSKVTQLAILHAYAHLNLGNRNKHTGSFVKSVTIGTHIAQFNANMTICFLWGSPTKRVTVNPKEVVKQLPFVKTVITSYL